MIDADVHVGGLEPTEAYSALLTSITTAVREVASRKRDVLPGLLEHLEDDVLVVFAELTPSTLGRFTCAAWCLGDRPVDTIHINANRGLGHESHTLAEDVLVTAIHEMVHAWNSLGGVRDCSNRGRYHNRRFAEVALQLGLQIRRHPTFGHETPGLRSDVIALYADLVVDLERALTLRRQSLPADQRRTLPASPSSATSADDMACVDVSSAKYVSASCACRDRRGRRRTLRMAAGWWPLGGIRCERCGRAFTAESLTRAGQVRGSDS